VLTLGLLLMLDGASKRWAATDLRPRGPRTVAGGHIRLRYHENPGFAFGLGGGRRPAALTVTSAAVAAMLLGLLMHRLIRRDSALLVTGLLALVAGTVGNLRDRLERGYVVDFIDYARWPLFNVADICLAVGMVLCAAGLTLTAWRPQPRPER
jgi:signal peptidase II